MIMLCKIPGAPSNHPGPRKEQAMAVQVCWVSDLDKALKTARQVNKPVLLDFFNPK